MQDDLDFSTDLSSQNSFDTISSNDCAELLDFEGNDTFENETSGENEIETIDVDDFGDEFLDFDGPDSEDSIETLDFDHTEISTASQTDSLFDEYSELQNHDFDESSIGGTVNDTSPDNANFEEIGEFSFSDLDSSNTPENHPIVTDITPNDFNETPDNTYVDGDIEPEDGGSAKVLTRDPNDLISVGNDLVQDRLEVLGDQYHSEGLSDAEVQSRLVDDKYEIQQEFLNDAFPGQNVTPDVFKRFDDATELAQDESSDITNISDVNNWLGEINPNFDEFDTESPYSNNCGSCAYAVWKRMEGDHDICASATNIGYNDEMEALTGLEQVSMTPDEIESNLLAQGNGAHAIIGIDRSEGPGHWFNAACIDGKVVAIDGQSGEILDWPPDYGNVVNWEMSVKKG